LPVKRSASTFFHASKHLPFPGGALMRTPALVLGMLYYRLRDLL
jgi:gamma-glutamylputrescine oxidase